MSHDGTPSSPTHCKLCASFAASDFPTAAERGLVGSDSFSRHPDICDACLDHDYAAVRRWGTFEQWAALTFGMCITFLTTFPVLRLFGRELGTLLSPLPAFLRLPAGLALVATAIAIPSVSLCWLLIHALFQFRIGRGKSAPDDPSDASHAERFRWLAAWAAATGHRRFERRMLKQAAAFASTRHPGGPSV
jgi:hypothetical protein